MSQFDPTDPDSLPPGFWQWPRPDRLAYYSAVCTRQEIIAHIRSFLGSNGNPTSGAPNRLTVEELAHIAADLGALGREERRGGDSE